MTYSIGEVAKMFDISTNSLRNWEKLGFIPRPNRTLTERRRYTDKDVQAIKDFLKRR